MISMHSDCYERDDRRNFYCEQDKEANINALMRVTFASIAFAAAAFASVCYISNKEVEYEQAIVRKVVEKKQNVVDLAYLCKNKTLDELAAEYDLIHLKKEFRFDKNRFEDVYRRNRVNYKDRKRYVDCVASEFILDHKKYYVVNLLANDRNVEQVVYDVAAKKFIEQ